MAVAAATGNSGAAMRDAWNGVLDVPRWLESAACCPSFFGQPTVAQHCSAVWDAIKVNFVSFKSKHRQRMERSLNACPGPFNVLAAQPPWHAAEWRDMFMSRNIPRSSIRSLFNDEFLLISTSER